MANSNNKPAIRFEGFTDEWKERKLGDEMTVASVKRILQSDWTSEGIRFLRARDIVASFKNEEPTDYLYISKEKYDKYSMISGKVAINDILVTGVGTIGIPYLINNSKPIYFKDGNIIWFQNEGKIDGEFFYYSFCGKSIQQYIKDSAGIGTVGTYTIESGKRTPIFLPRKDEQKVIGAYFQNLENLITLQQRKYEKLQNTKKSMLDKMFPKAGCTVPEIRFKGFTGEWEERKLGEVCQITMGQSPDGRTYSDTPSDYILVQGNADLKNGWVYPRFWTTQKTKTAKVNDLIMSVRAPAGAMGKTSYNVVLGRGVAGIKGNEFIYQILVKKDADGYWKKLAAGSTFDSINSDTINNAEIMVPQDIAEQKALGEYFRNLDNLITLQQRKLEKLKNLKQACLEKMFV